MPELLVTAIAGNNNVILTVETDPDSCMQTIHIMIGKFISPCMIQKLIGQAEFQRVGELRRRTVLINLHVSKTASVRAPRIKKIAGRALYTPE